MDRPSRRQIRKLESLLAKTESLFPAVLTKMEESRVLLEVMIKALRERVDDPDYGRRHSWWDPSIVHAPESPRFTEIFSAAPVWLLQFTTLRLDAQMLEFELPDISADLIWGVEGVKNSKRWPLLPLGTMAAGDPVSSLQTSSGAISLQRSGTSIRK
jgi:hypothetical protein